MGNKADYTTLINTKLPDSLQIPSADHRDTMTTDPNSIIELVYGGTVDDDELAQTYTTSNAIFDYKIRIWKVGSDVHISGNFDVNVSIDGGSTVFVVTDTDFLSTTTGVFNFVGMNNTNVLPLLLSDSVLTTRATVFAGESYDFTIIYKSLN